MGIIHVKLHKIWTSGSGGDVFQRNSLSMTDRRALAALLFDGAEPFVQF